MGIMRISRLTAQPSSHTIDVRSVRLEVGGPILSYRAVIGQPTSSLPTGASEDRWAQIGQINTALGPLGLRLRWYLVGWRPARFGKLTE